jgi:hypothetical protein
VIPFVLAFFILGIFTNFYHLTHTHHHHLLFHAHPTLTYSLTYLLLHIVGLDFGTRHGELAKPKMARTVYGVGWLGII